MAALDNIKSSIADQLSVVTDYFSRLNERDKIIVMLGSCVALLLLMALLLGIFYAGNRSYQKTISSSKKNQRDIQRLVGEYQGLNEDVNTLIDKIRLTPKNFRLGTELEKLANTHKIEIDLGSSVSGPPNEYFDETLAPVSLDKVELRSLLRFLNDIEQSRKIMKISSLELNAHYKDPSKLKAKFKVSTYALKDELEE